MSLKINFKPDNMCKFCFTFLSVLILISATQISAQQTWKNGKRITVCLTYDDAMDSQLDAAGPQLDKHGFKGTFYLKGSSPSVYHRMDEWKALAANGHELGNHTLFHPCSGKRFPNREKDRDIDYYTIKRFLSEVAVSNTLLKSLDGKDKRTFAYTCGDKIVEGENIGKYLPKYVNGARGGAPDFLKKENIDVYHLPTFSCTGKTGDQMIRMVEKAKESNGLLILVFHGVGGGHLKVESTEHEKLLKYLKEHEEEIWVAPVIDVVEYLK